MPLPSQDRALKAAFLCCLAYSDGSPDELGLETAAGPTWMGVRFCFSKWRRIGDEGTDAQALCCYERRSGTCWVVFAGTQSLTDALCDAYALRYRAGFLCDDDGSAVPRVHAGFLTQYQSIEPAVTKYIAECAAVGKQAGSVTSVTVTGHSLGAALALLCATDLAVNASGLQAVACLAFGCPRVGDAGFVRRVRELRSLDVRRYILRNDPITRVPSRFFFEHAGEAHRLHGTSRPATVEPTDSWWSAFRLPVPCRLGNHDMTAYLEAVAQLGGAPAVRRRRSVKRGLFGY